MVDGQVTLLKHGSQLELVGRHFVVTCLNRNTQFKGLDFQIFHKSCHTGRDGTEIVVFELLVL